MKVTVEQEQEVFRPVKLTISIEDKKSLSALLNLVGYYESVPYCIAENGYLSDDEQAIISKMLLAMYKELHKSIN